MGKIITLISIAALVLALLLGGLGPAYRFGVLDLAQAFNFMKMLTLPALIAAGVAGLAFVGALLKARGQAVIALVAALPDHALDVGHPHVLARQTELLEQPQA